MLIEQPEVAKIKNQWLYSQVEVEHPTPQSLSGCKLYLSTQPLSRYHVCASLPDAVPETLDTLFLVDFHRLTVMFALLQSTLWQGEETEQNDIIEFLTQIIYSEPCQLYLGFREGEAVSAAIVTVHGDQLLVSDVYLQGCQEEQERTLFAAQVARKWLQTHPFSGSVIIEQRLFPQR